MTIDDVFDVDVLVCGAGCAGLGAAVQAARAGANVLVVEKNGFAGGFITSVMSPHLDGMFDTATGEVVVGGLPVEIMELLCGIDISDSYANRFEIGGDITKQGKEDGPVDPEERVTVEFDVEPFKLIADHLLVSSGADVLYHTVVCAVSTANGLIESVTIANKGGLQLIRPSVVIDCTGDGDVMAWAGAPFELSPNLQPMTLHFRIAGVEVTSDIGDRCGAVLTSLQQEGEIDRYGGPWMMKAPNGDVIVNSTRVPGNHADPWMRSRAEIQSRRDAWRMFEAWKDALPEFSDAYLVSTGPEMGARETRRLIGDYQLTGSDIESVRSFDDAVIRGTWYLDRHPVDVEGYHHHPSVEPYDIPYRTMTTGAVGNLLVAGRCHSVTQEAHASTRVTVTAMGLGQAAGAAAASALEQGGQVRSPVTIANVTDFARESGLLRRTRTGAR